MSGLDHHLKVVDPLILGLKENMQNQQGRRTNTELYIEGPRPGAEVPGLTQENLKRFEDQDPVGAAVASVVASLPPSDTTPIPGFEIMAKVANAKVKA